MAASSPSERKLRSPKLPLVGSRYSLLNLVARAAEASPSHLTNLSPRLAPNAPAHTPLIVWSVAEKAGTKDGGAKNAAGRSGHCAPSHAGSSMGVYLEKGLGDAFRPFNLTLSTVVALGSAAALEAVRTGNLPVDAGDAEPEEAEPMDWWLVGSNFGLALTRDLSGSTCQRSTEKLLKPRVYRGLYDEMIKSVPKMARKGYLAEMAAGRSQLGARIATAKLVLRSPVYYLSSAVPRLLTDITVDVLRLFFPKEWRSRLTVPSFTRNARLKTVKYALQMVCSLCGGTLIALLWPHPYTFVLSDLLAAQAAEITVNSFLGQVE